MQPNPWRNLPDRPDYVLPDDKLAVDVFNSDAEESVRLHLDTPPEPFFGPFDAPIVVLLLNPGVSKSGEYDAGLADTVRRSDEQAKHFYIGRGGNRWWDRIVRPLARARPECDLARSILSVEFFPYRSVSFGCSCLRVPSQEFSFALVRQAIDRRAVIVFGRGERQWMGAVPQLKAAAVIRMNNPRMASLSAANLGMQGFQSLLGALADTGKR